VEFFVATVGIVSSESRRTSIPDPDAADRRACGHGGCRVHSLDGAIRGQALSRGWSSLAKAARSRSWLRGHGLFALPFFSGRPGERSSANEGRSLCTGRPDFSRHGARKVLLHFRNVASGIPLGREGPAVQVGAGIASVLGRKLGLSPERVKALVPVGAERRPLSPLRSTRPLPRSYLPSRKLWEIYTRRCWVQWCWPRRHPGRCCDCCWTPLEGSSTRAVR